MGNTETRFTNRPRRRAFTLIEMLLAASITAMVAMAGTALVFAISNASQTNRNICDTKNLGHYALSRATRKIRSARAVGTVMPRRVVLWAADVNEDDELNLNEIAIISYDNATKKLVYRHLESSSDTTVITEAQFTNATTVRTLLDNAGAENVVWATGIESLDFIGYPADTETRVVDVHLTILNGEEEVDFRSTASPKAPADYLFLEEARIDPADASDRVRRKHYSRWDGFSDL
ncbi:MAG: prepilin-type N-terminal cleavage/methylation domain-containing protein [Planctomycetota bacterium]